MVLLFIKETRMKDNKHIPLTRPQTLSLPIDKYNK
jgi:hypothetical protein